MSKPPKPPKLDINGWIILDKPTGITSAAAVAVVKRITQCKKIGHGGTLDPLASGILPLALGEATKLFDYVVSEKKSYRFTVTWGEQRDTDDAEGQVVGTSELRPTREQVEAALPEFIGTVMQTPPQYSAIKINGERAYALARSGEEVNIAAREVDIFDLRVTHHNEGVSTVFETSCGKGTYVRSLARDLGLKLKCLGFISELRRTAVGIFSEQKAISLEFLEKLGHNAALTECVKPVEFALDDILATSMDSNQASQLKQGRAVYVHRGDLPPDGDILALMHEQHIVALGEVKGRVVHPVRVFNHN
jgi:tRNA pseudouridine55 synthase